MRYIRIIFSTVVIHFFSSPALANRYLDPDYGPSGSSGPFNPVLAVIIAAALAWSGLFISDLRWLSYIVGSFMLFFGLKEGGMLGVFLGGVILAAAVAGTIRDRN